MGDPRSRAERLLLCDDCEQVQPQAARGPSADRRALVECLRGVAADYRQRDPGRPAGVVLIWQGVAYGWKDRLRDPASERPGAYAVDEAGAIHCATGGNDYDGAQAWRPLECER